MTLFSLQSAGAVHTALPGEDACTVCRSLDVAAPLGETSIDPTL